MHNRKDRFYIAYGSNLNLRQMRHRCPTAEIVGTSRLQGWQLRFRGELLTAVATIEPAANGIVPVLVWKLQPKDEYALDRYEGWPYLYRKENLELSVDKERILAMVYIMNEDRYSYNAPSKHYLATILEGYKSSGFDEDILQQAVQNSLKGDAKK